MLDAGVSTAFDPTIVEIYHRTKTLMKEGKFNSALAYLRTLPLVENWESLLLHSMRRRNCPVTKLVIKAVITSQVVQPDEIKLRVSKVDHLIQLDFAERVNLYVKSNEFATEYDRYENVRKSAVTQIRSHLNGEFVNPNKF